MDKWELEPRKNNSKEDGNTMIIGWLMIIAIILWLGFSGHKDEKTTTIIVPQMTAQQERQNTIEWQTFLVNEGFDIAIDGVWGQETEDAYNYYMQGQEIIEEAMEEERYDTRGYIDTPWGREYE